MAKYFINITNHYSVTWSKEQQEAAKEYGEEIIDHGFPGIPPRASSDSLSNEATTLVNFTIDKFGNDIVALVQGEMTMTYKIVNEFKRHGITCVAATSEREVVKTTQSDGKTNKTSVFKFVAFREY